MTPMQKLIHDRLTFLGISGREATKRSEGLLSHATLSRISNGLSAGPWNTRTLKGLALALDVPMSEVEKVAGLPVNGAEFKLPREASRLSPEERKAVLAVVTAMLSKHGVKGKKM